MEGAMTNGGLSVDGRAVVGWWMNGDCRQALVAVLGLEMLRNLVLTLL